MGPDSLGDLGRKGVVFVSQAVGGAEFQNGLWRALSKHAARALFLVERGHELVLVVEGNLLQLPILPSQDGQVQARGQRGLEKGLVREVSQDAHVLRAVAQVLGLGPIADRADLQHAKVMVVHLFLGQVPAVRRHQAGYLHLSLGERARLVRADDRYAAERLGRHQAAGQRLGLQDLLHANGQDDSNGNDQPLGYGRDCHGHRDQEHLQDVAAREEADGKERQRDESHGAAQDAGELA